MSRQALNTTLLSVLIAATAPSSFAKDEVDYNFDIKPILSDRCYKCHGPDAHQRQADLRLDIATGVQTPLARGVISPGQPDESELFHRISSRAPDLRMPPPHAKLPPLSEDQVELLRQWIEQGVPWKRHWSFIPLAETTVPNVRDTAWPRNPIDCFVLSRLEQMDQRPSPAAEKETWLRRVTFDLTGLPPSLEEIDAFLDAFLDDGSSVAREEVVDRLLATQRYGERMAVHWLDVARYADSYGYQVDKDRRVWPWRDWVIDALNRNMSYDQFITWQLAGDLLASATDDQILATAFNRLHPQKSEGGTVEEEFRVEYVADRTHTFATAFLGLTLECARCHDHKYDSVTQREYYQLFAFFNNIDESGLYPYHNFDTSVPTPALLLADASVKRRISELENLINAASDKLFDLRGARRQAFEQWLSAQAPGETPLLPGRVARLSFDEVNAGKYANGDDDEVPGLSSAENRMVPGRFGNAIRLTGDHAVRLPSGAFTRDDPFSVSLWINAPREVKRTVVFHRSMAWTDSGSRGYQLLIEQGRLSASLIHFWPGDAMRVRTQRVIPTNQWLHVAMTYDGSSEAHGLTVYLDGQPESCDVIRDSLTKSINDEAGHFVIGARKRDQGFTRGLVDELQLFARALTSLEVLQLYDGQGLTAALAQPTSRRAPKLHEQLYDFYLSNADGAYRAQLKRLHTLRKSRSELIDPLPEIMVMREMAARRPTFLLERGAYNAPREFVSPLTPAALSQFPADQQADRLGLAAWLTDPAHPLTARVAVNRFWQLCFGEGLVRTPEDFGSQGELPTHPALLDWLAKDFIDSGWDIKRLLKRIVTSSTYGQSSRPRQELETRDPENRLLARGPRHRLSAEMIRDNALAASGLLVERIGGEPTRPYEVAVSFKPLEQGTGESLYRRSLYTNWRRTGPPPMMMSLDAAKRDVCVVRRERTLTPLQALVLLNSPQMVEASRVLGERMVRKHGADTPSLLDELYRLLTSRQPNDRERDILTVMYEEQRSHFSQPVERAEAFLTIGESSPAADVDAARAAAAGAVACALMNFDACINKR